MRSPWAPLSLLATALAASATLGCEKQVQIHLHPDDALNENRPCYVVVRNVDSKTYLEETYQAASLQVTAPDDSVLETAVVFPGTKKVIKVAPPAKGMVALYVFFYHPTGDWKAIFPATEATYEIVLEGGRLRIATK